MKVLISMIFVCLVIFAAFYCAEQQEVNPATYGKIKSYIIDNPEAFEVRKEVDRALMDAEITWYEYSDIKQSMKNYYKGRLIKGLRNNLGD